MNTDPRMEVTGGNCTHCHHAPPNSTAVFWTFRLVYTHQNSTQICCSCFGHTLEQEPKLLTDPDRWEIAEKKQGFISRSSLIAVLASIFDPISGNGAARTIRSEV